MDPFVQSLYFTPRSSRRIRLIVVHSMENDPVRGTAMSVARWFQQPKPKDRRASAHYMVDPWETVQGVRDQDEAWHAPGANGDGIGVELAGRAGWSGAQWLAAPSDATLTRSAAKIAELCAAYRIPAEYLSAAGVLQGDSGITTHVEIARAYHRTDHWDPGPGFPMGEFISRVRGARPAPVDWAAIAAWVEAVRLQEDRDMAEPGIPVAMTMHPSGDGRGYVLDRWGGVHPVGGAKPVKGAPYWQGLDVARAVEIVDWDGPSGYVLDCRGGVHAFGPNAKPAKGPYWKDEPLRRFAVGQKP